VNIYSACLILLGLIAIVASCIAQYHANRARNLSAQNDILRQDIDNYWIGAMALSVHIENLEARRYVILRRFWKRTTYRKLAAIPTWRKS
jgi:hypothetical protein